MRYFVLLKWSVQKIPVQNASQHIHESILSDKVYRRLLSISEWQFDISILLTLISYSNGPLEYSWTQIFHSTFKQTHSQGWTRYFFLLDSNLWFSLPNLFEYHIPNMPPRISKIGLKLNPRSALSKSESDDESKSSLMSIEAESEVKSGGSTPKREFEPTSASEIDESSRNPPSKKGDLYSMSYSSKQFTNSTQEKGSSTRR